MRQSVHGQQFGDYIHYNYKNYLTHGVAIKTSFTGEKGNSIEHNASFKNIINQHKAIIQQCAGNKTATAKQLERNLNFFSHPTSGSNKVELTEAARNNIIQIITKIMENTWDLVAGGLDFENARAEMRFDVKNRAQIAAFGGDEKNGLYQLASIADSHAGQTTHSAKGKEVKTGFNLKNMQVRADNTLKYAQQIIDMGRISGRSGMDLVTAAKLLQEKIDDFRKEFGYQAKGTIAVGSKKYAEMEKFQDLIRTIAKECIYREAQALCEGELAEFIVAAVSNETTQTVNKTTEELLNKLVVGQNRSASTINAAGPNGMVADVAINLENLFASEGDKRVYQANYGLTQSGRTDLLTWTGKSTQNKVDVQIGEIAASVKNYDLSDKSYGQNVGISLVSKANLLAIMMQSPLFANHYLNIAGTNETHTNNNTLLGEANRALKQLIFITAISGQRYKDQVFANYFIVNNKSQGQWKVYVVNDLIKRVSNNLSLVSVKLSDKELNDDLTWNNTWVAHGGDTALRSMALAYKRIANLVHQVSQTKVDAHIKTEALGLNT